MRHSPATACVIGLLCCRTLFATILLIVASFVAVSINGSEYVLSDACRIINFEGGQKLENNASMSIGGSVLFSKPIDSMKFDCDSEESHAVGKDSLRKTCYDECDPTDTSFTSYCYRDKDSCQNARPCDDKDFILCDCSEITWATHVKVGDLPRYCGWDGTPNVFHDPGEKVSGLFFILPIISWYALRLLGTCTEIASLANGRKALGSATLGYFALTLVPNFLLRNATDLELIESIPGIAVLTQTDRTNYLAGCSIFYICMVAGFVKLNVTADEEEDGYQRQRFICGCCVCLCALPFLLCEFIAIMASGKPFGFTVDISLQWPKSALSKRLTIARVILFIVGSMDVIGVCMMPLKRMAKAENNVENGMHTALQVMPVGNAWGSKNEDKNFIS